MMWFSFALVQRERERALENYWPSPVVCGMFCKYRHWLCPYTDHFQVYEHHSYDDMEKETLNLDEALLEPHCSCRLCPSRPPDVFISWFAHIQYDAFALLLFSVNIYCLTHSPQLDIMQMYTVQWIDTEKREFMDGQFCSNPLVLRQWYTISVETIPDNAKRIMLRPDLFLRYHMGLIGLLSLTQSYNLHEVTLPA